METDTVPDLKIGKLFRCHLTDWFAIVGLFALWGACQVITPFQRYVGAANFTTASIMYPYKSNTIPFQAVPAIALLVPLFFIFVHFFHRRSVRDLHHAFLGLLTTVALTALVTDAIKIGIGRPRPHFYARCFGSTTAIAQYDNIGNVICRTSPALMKEAYKSFPSGHTSWSFAGLGYLSMYLAGKLGVFDHGGHSWKLFPVVLPVLGATFVAITRVDDYWHHWTDVCTGAAIGLLSAYFCYRQHFPSLFDDAPSIPYAHRPRAVSSQSSSQTNARQSQALDRDSSKEMTNDLERGSSQIPML
jgi:membrane-associated phospholipid phosphatase